MEQTGCSEISAYKIRMLGNYPEESIQKFTSCLRLPMWCYWRSKSYGMWYHDTGWEVLNAPQGQAAPHSASHPSKSLSSEIILGTLLLQIFFSWRSGVRLNPLVIYHQTDVLYQKKC